MACTSPAINNPNALNPADAANQTTLRNGRLELSHIDGYVSAIARTNQPLVSQRE